MPGIVREPASHRGFHRPVAGTFTEFAIIMVGMEVRCFHGAVFHSWFEAKGGMTVIAQQRIVESSAVRHNGLVIRLSDSNRRRAVLKRPLPLPVFEAERLMWKRLRRR